ncbi:hypothetical protein D3C79_783560 [compost metagenome]
MTTPGVLGELGQPGIDHLVNELHQRCLLAVVYHHPDGLVVVAVLVVVELAQQGGWVGFELTGQ